MNCPNCERENPGDAQFCIYCAARLTPVVPTSTTAPVTGPTTRLDPASVPVYAMPGAPATAVPQGRAARPPRAKSRRHRHKDATKGVWLIGIGVLLLTGTFFPGILVLIGITQYLKESGRSRYAKANQSLVFFLGLAAIFWWGLSWPLLILWFGLLMVLNQRH